MSQQYCPTCQNQVAVTDTNCCADCGSEMPSVGSPSNNTASGSAPSGPALNPFADLELQSTATQQDFQAAAAAFVAPVDAASAFAVLQQASTQNKYPPEDYLQATRGLWNYSEMPVSCPQCGNKFNLKDHRRKLRKRAWLLIPVMFFVGCALSMFVPNFPLVGSILKLMVISFCILPVFMIPKAVFYKCYRCNWTKKFIVRSGVR